MKSLQGNNPVIHQALTSTLYDAACGQTAAIYTGKTCQTRSRILNSNNWLETNFEYDNFGRTTHTKGNSHVNLTIGSEQSTFIYDYADNPVSTSRIHDAFGQQMVIAERMTYDHAGRLDETFHRVGTGAEQLISKQEYTIKDELSTKHLGGVSNGFLQKLDYVYLDNGFLKDINPTMETNDLFQFTINYDGGNGTLNATAQKNGNISQLTWQVKGKTKQSYGFQYDFLNRLTEATYGDYGTGALQANNKYSSTYGYDNRGNIMSLTRQGFLPNSTYAQIDNLSYAYNSNSNRLKSISDTAPTASKAEGYKPGLSTDYGYDANGNMNYDPSKDINIRYNHLNLPEFIEFDNCNAIEYTYNATGVKLTKTLKKGNAITSTHDYIGGIEYKNQVIDAIYHSEGRLYFEGASSRYEYVLKDHLGNQRVLFSDANGDGSIDVNTEVLQTTAYYPFGMTMQGDFVQNSGRENKYLYNGKELQDDFGLGWYDYGARFYDSAIGRWNHVDDLAHEYSSISPYSYVANMPTIAIDPDGNRIVIANDKYYQQVLNDLAKVYSTKKGRALIDRLASSETTYTIYGGAITIKGALFAGTRYNKLTNNLTYYQKTARVDGVFNPSYITLGHELYHAYQDEIGAKANYPKQTEADAMKFENYLRDVFGLGEHRVKHGGSTHLTRVTALSSNGERVDVNSVKISKVISGQNNDEGEDTDGGRDNTKVRINNINVHNIIEYMDKNGIQKLNLEFDQTYKNNKP